jgi:Fe-S-cluster containining protein
MKPNKARSLLKQLYYKVDKEIDSKPKVCQRGCFFCCYQPIEIFTIEKVTLGEYIQKELSSETKQAIKEKTIEWLDFFDRNTPSKEPLTSKAAYVDFRTTAKSIPFPCPLLFNGECSVYKARPLACRVHYVNDDKKLCEEDKMRDGEATAYRMELVEELKTETTVEVISLPYALVEILNIDRRMKKIEKAIL